MRPPLEAAVTRAFPFPPAGLIVSPLLLAVLGGWSRAPRLEHVVGIDRLQVVPIHVDQIE